MSLVPHRSVSVPHHAGGCKAGCPTPMGLVEKPCFLSINNNSSGWIDRNKASGTKWDRVAHPKRARRVSPAAGGFKLRASWRHTPQAPIPKPTRRFGASSCALGGLPTAPPFLFVFPAKAGTHAIPDRVALTLVRVSRGPETLTEVRATGFRANKKKGKRWQRFPFE